jgi:hypothetical protein
MPTTRSAAKQTQVDGNREDRKSGSAARKRPATNGISKSKKAASGSVTKRPATEKPGKTRPTEAETTRQTHSDFDTASKSEKSIIINRAPVLQLWSACVAQLLHPELGWDTCLSIGGAVSSFCAISKGRAIGMIEPKDADGYQQSKKKQNGERVEVMGFGLHIKDGNALISGKPKPVKEDTLRTKFGSEEYDASLVAFRKALSTWKGKEEELDKKAFHMYERFRPNVSGGQKGWGRKGELDLTEVANVIAK